MLECEYLVIGGGETGLTVAKELARYGKKTILIEEKKLGGGFVHVRDVPKTALMRESIQYFSALGTWSDDLITLKKLQEKRENIQKEIQKEIQKQEVFSENQLKQHPQITYIQGKVEIVSKTLVEVNSATERHLINFSQCVIAVGKEHLAKPELLGIENISFLYEDTIFHLPEIPQSLGIIGITPESLEVANIYSNLGVEVHIYQSKNTPELQQLLDNSAINYVYKKLFEKRVSIHPKIIIQRVAQAEQRIELIDEENNVHTVSHVFIPLKREFSEESIRGLERVGISYTKKGIQTDQYGTTKSPHFSALGECNSRTNNGNKHALIHRFLEKNLGKTEFSLPGKSSFLAIPYSVEPNAIKSAIQTIHSQNPVCTILLPETEAIGKFGPIAKTRSFYDPVTDSFIKIVYKKSSGELLGITLAGWYCNQLKAMCVYAAEQNINVRDLINYLKTYIAIQ